ncbi:hypothetical protein RchiOBHm_Chr1g0327291 [Rosa chinensis]|uniref:Uncharacterized protein n=1 Tax=Rosa chinensis TaxID=74649 RepID=A0A2P6SAI8_ROSCH|nr:hypothetical protein RchiOBHm_Chr1g0327291 [Rosa chinensis]
MKQATVEGFHMRWPPLSVGEKEYRVKEYDRCLMVYNIVNQAL